MPNIYYENAKRAETYTTEPTMTDQSQAAETDINVIVGRMLPTNMVPGRPGEPIYADWTTVPKDLRDLINQGRSLMKHHSELPAALQEFAIEDLIQLTPQEINSILRPVQPTGTQPTDKTEPPK